MNLSYANLDLSPVRRTFEGTLWGDPIGWSLVAQGVKDCTQGRTNDLEGFLFLF